MKKLIILSFTLFTIHSSLFSQSGPPWVGANFGFGYIFTAIDFPSNQNTIGFAGGESLTYSGDGIVIKTTDGGSTWTQMWGGPDRGVEGMCFVDTQTGYIAGWPKLGQGWSGFAKTTDGGVTWTSYPVTTDIYFYTDVVFKDANNGILIGQTNFAAGVWVTANGGTSWLSGTGITAIPQHACYVSGNTYYLVDNNGSIQRSTNNGMNWTTVYSTPGLILLGIKFYNDSIGMAVGDNGVVLATYDAGTTWTAHQVGVDIWHGIAWENPNHVVICGTPGLVFESWDGGNTWGNANPQGVGQVGLYEILFTADDHGFICGSQGTEIKRNPSCGAAFTATPTAACTGSAVNFTSQSWGNISAYKWTFEGGTPSTSTEQNPVVIYSTPGTFDVRLKVTNAWWADSLKKTDYISVAVTPDTPEITADGYLLTSSVPQGNQWLFNDSLIPGATGQTYEATQSGWYSDIVSQNGCSSDTSNRIYLVMTATEEFIVGDLTIAPVPNKGRFTLSAPQLTVAPCSVEIFNNTGARIWSEPQAILGRSAVLNVDLGRVAEGIYLVVVNDGDSRWVKKMIVSR